MWPSVSVSNKAGRLAESNALRSSEEAAVTSGEVLARMRGREEPSGGRMKGMEKPASGEAGASRIIFGFH